MPGSLDTSFNPSIRLDGTVVVIAAQTDGKLIVGGDFARVGTTNTSALARLNADGSVDTTFTPLIHPGTLTYAAVGPDNKVVALFKQPGNTPQSYTLLRLNTDGSQDAGFTPASFRGLPDSGDLYDFVLAVQPDDKVLVGGPFSTDPTSTLTTTTIIRYNSDGSPDTGFQLPSTLQLSTVNSLLALADGQTLVGGSLGVIRLDADGSLDGSYPAATSYYASAYALTVQSDGKVLFLQSSAETYGILGGTPERLNADGSPDTSFAPSLAQGATFSALVLQPDGKIVVGGYTAIDTSGGFVAGQTSGVVRLNADGTTDATFNPITPLVDNKITALGLQTNGQIIAGGVFDSFAGLARGGLGRINADGSTDATFDNNLTNAGTAYSVAVEAGGQPLVADSGTLVDGTLASSLFSFNTDGSLSTVFAAELSSSQYFQVHSSAYESFDPVVAVQSDGKVLLTGNFQPSATGFTRRLQRFNTDGSLDSTFQIPTDSDYSVLEALVPQPNGQTYIAGAFSFGSSIYSYPLNRVNADGSFDSAFTAATDPGATNYSSSVIQALAVQSDGKPLVAGDLVYVDGQPQSAVLRFNTDGSLDTSFNTGPFTTPATESGTTFALALQADGKLLVGGYFAGLGGVASNNIARLNADGSIDTSFNVGGTGADSVVKSIAIQANGQIVLAGGFTMVNGVPSAGLARLNTDGTVDPLFFPGTGTGGTGVINSLALAPDGSLIVGGTFTTFDGQARDGVARLVGGDVIAPVITSATTATAQVDQVFTYQVAASNNPTSFAAAGLPAGLSVSPATGLITGTPTVVGTSIVTISATNLGGTGSAALTLTVNPAAPMIDSSGSVTGQVGQAFTYRITASNNATSFGSTALPAGLSFSPATGVIGGTPTVAGTSAITLSATNAGGTGSAALTLTILPPAPQVTLVATSASAQVGQAFSYRITASNAPTSYGAAGLPAGLSVAAATGVISGIPSAAGTFKVTLSAANAGGTGTAMVSLIVVPALPVATLAATLPTVTTGSGEIGEFTLVLSPAPSSDVVVNLAIKGTAVDGTDYVLLAMTKKIKAGHTSKPIKITPQGDLGGVSKKTVKLELEPGTGYTVGTTGKVKVSILAAP